MSQPAAAGLLQPACCNRRGCRGVLIDVTDTLAARLARDREAAFPELVASLAGPVLSLLRRNGLDGPTAEDLAQEAFLAAWAALGKMDADTLRELRLRPWLLTIALNLLRNHWRTRSRRPATTTLDAPRCEGAADITADGMGGADQPHDLAGALAGLPARQRQAVVLRHVIGLPTSEVAEVLAVPVGTAKSDISRGLVALRRTLEAAT